LGLLTLFFEITGVNDNVTVKYTSIKICSSPLVLDTVAQDIIEPKSHDRLRNLLGRAHFDLVICDIEFDQSRMFELLQT
jgi:23S rRNA U2552 (ribose-2'-O)-methylase RlmE/FtsJ